MDKENVIIGLALALGIYWIYKSRTAYQAQSTSQSVSDWLGFVG
jgi:hypothetical protein